MNYSLKFDEPNASLEAQSGTVVEKQDWQRSCSRNLSITISRASIYLPPLSYALESSSNGQLPGFGRPEIPKVPATWNTNNLELAN
jgi:hypothetical protein